MAEKRFGMFRFGTCDWCQDGDKPLTKYHRTGEYLCDACVTERDRELPAKEKRNQEEKDDQKWDELTMYT